MPLSPRLARARRAFTVSTLAAVAVACGQGPPRGAGAAAGASPAPSASSRVDRAAFAAQVDALAAEALERGPIAGLSIAVFEGGQAVVAKGYGLADVDSQVAATADTSYPIASVTKHVTAAMVLRLADQGRLTLDDPLSRFFPEARPAIGVLTVRHLLEHTSGLTRPGPAPRQAAVSVLARGGTALGQGLDWDYSNYNYSLLGLVIEKVSGRDYARAVQDEIAGPLGLKGTGYCEDGTAVPGRGRDYLSGPRSLTPTPYWTEAKFFAGGGLCSTVVDLVRFVSALESAGRVISPSMLQAMRTPARLASGLEAGYGLGTRLGLTGRHRKFGHTGGGQSNKAVLARYPEEDVTVVVLLNSERPGAPITATEIEEQVERLFFFGAASPAPPTGSVPASDLARYAGEYRDSSGTVRITADGRALVARPGMRRRAVSRLLPAGGDAFAVEDDLSYEVRFQMDGARPRGYQRFNNGWFVGLAPRPGVTAED